MCKIHKKSCSLIKCSCAHLFTWMWIKSKSLPIPSSSLIFRNQSAISIQQLCIMKGLILLGIFLILSVGIESKSINEGAELGPEALPFQLEFPNPMNEIEIFFDCNDNKFIRKELICDGQKDCKNGADEEYCQDTFSYSKWLRWKMTLTDVVNELKIWIKKWRKL